jgi:hypothetical protein
MSGRQERKIAVAITDEQVAAMRAYLVGDIERYEHALAQLDHAAQLDYVTLVSAAFFEAVEKRFNEGSVTTEVAAFVGHLRARSEDLANSISPEVAERLIRDVYTDEGVSDIPDETKGSLHALLLAGMVADEQYDDSGLDEFLGKARKLADDLLSS